jgi:hemolysin activation/secretion protein
MRFELSRLAVVPCLFTVFAAGQSALAQVPIGAGGQMQQIPAPPPIERDIPSLPIPSRPAPAAAIPAGTRFPVRALHIAGQTKYFEAELIVAAEFKPGNDMSLPDLQAMADRITHFYNDRGFILARAYLPAQDITDGTVTIAVLEGHYGKIELHNEATVSDAVLTNVLGGLNSGDMVGGTPLERRLLIMSDIPGVAVQSTLSPGTDVGTSDLTVTVTPGRRVDGSAEASNWGNPYTGTYLLGGNINYYEPFGIGDVLGLRVLGSTTGDLAYARAFYQAQFGDATVGVAFTALDYHLGKQFSPLNARGTEEIVSIYASYPLIRSYNNNLSILADFDERFFQDNIGATPANVSKQASVLTLQLSGDSHDRFGGGGWNAYSIAGVFGDFDIKSGSARALDRAGPRTDGGYAKLVGSASRLQTLYGALSLYGSVRGQVASKNLDISEKMELGGATGVRAFPEGEAYGDQGYIATLEARLLLPPLPPSVPGRVQLIAFADTGYVTANQSAYGRGTNDLSRSGAGVGVIWSDPNDFAVTVTYAYPIGDTKATSYPGNSGQLWVKLVKYF